MSDSNIVTKRCPQAIYFPAVTYDYYLKNDDEIGLGLVARRKIRKGTLVFSDAIEYMFTDVVEGDYLLLQGHNKASKLSGTKVPPTLVITKEMLLRTHGVPALTKNSTCGASGVISWRLEVPGMLMNHSCSPNVVDDSHDAAKGEGYASRNIKKGEELTYNYLFQYYNRGPFFDRCQCGSEVCLGKMMGFKALSNADKEKYYPMASAAVQAMHDADVKKVSQPREEQPIVPYETFTNTDAKRFVFPGPSYALAGVEIKQDDEGKFYLCATKDFAFGEQVYEFWRNDWPFGGFGPIEMIAPLKLSNGDLSEGTAVRLIPTECAAKKDRSGHYKFSGFDLLLLHSCEPNLTYNDHNDDEDDDWQVAYAATDIKVGDKLTIDYNSVLWDRSTSLNADECHCGMAKCVGTMKGFKHLSKEAQLERKQMTWRRVLPPYEGEKDTNYLGMALTPFVRQQWRKDDDQGADCPDTASSSSSSSSDDSTSDDEE